jgi:predicted transposase YdaD
MSSHSSTITLGIKEENKKQRGERKGRKEGREKKKKGKKEGKKSRFYITVFLVFL